MLLCFQGKNDNHQIHNNNSEEQNNCGFLMVNNGSV